jgi:uncharacterized protein
VGRFLTFIAVAFTLLGGIHYYLWRRLVHDPAWRPRWKLIGGVALSLLAGSIVSSLILGRGQGAVHKAFAWPGYVWLGVMFLFLITLATVDLFRVAALLVRRAAGNQAPAADRRQFIARVAAAGATTVVAAASAVALRPRTAPPPSGRSPSACRACQPSSTASRSYNSPTCTSARCWGARSCKTSLTERMRCHPI